MKYCYLLLSSIFLISSCKKDPAIPTEKPIEFQKNYGGAGNDYARAVVENTNGDLFIVGSTQSYGAGGQDVYVIKTDEKGNTIWTKTFGGAANEEANEVIFSSDGNLLILGNTSSYGAGGNDVYLLKIDTTGALLWQKNYGGAANESGEDIMQTPDGNYMISGATASYGSGARDMYVLKINTFGTVIWSKTFGGIADDGAVSLCNADSGKVMLFGYTDNYGALNRDWYVLKINSIGDSLGSWLYGGAEYEQAASIEPTSDGNFVILGHTASFGHIEHNMYAAKITSNGAIVWENNYGGAFHDGGEHGKQSSDGGYILAGSTMSFGNNSEQAYLVKTDASGNMLWQKDFGGDNNDLAYNMIETQSAYILVGYTASFTNGNNDVFLMKILK
jgi:hypothetical protein